MKAFAQKPDALGVGFSYSTALEPVIQQCPELLGVLELEPQTLWVPQSGGGYRVDWQTVERIRGFGVPILLHGVNNPVGGSLRPDRTQARYFAETARAVQAPWVSEHLSFNRVATDGGATEFAGFMLPPLQSAAGVEEAANSIRALAEAVGYPLAIETGVNYLQPIPGEMEDGAFVAAVAERADCGILLDLHNIWTNQRNGRQSVEGFLSQLPLERVWEVHMAGGSERDGYWLDSHVGGVPEPLWALARELLPDLPALGAVIFEIFPVNVPALGIPGVIEQLEKLNKLWSETRKGVSRRPERKPPILTEFKTEPGSVSKESPAQWERDLVGSIRQSGAASARTTRVSADPGVAIVSSLVDEFRAAMVVQNLQLTSTLLFLTLGKQEFRDLLANHARRWPPEPFAVDEARAFARSLEEALPTVPYLGEVLAFEKATLDTLLDGEARVVSFRHDPLPLLRALAQGQMPANPGAGNYEVEVTPDELESRHGYGLAVSH